MAAPGGQGWLNLPRPSQPRTVDIGPTGAATATTSVTLVGGLAPALDVRLAEGQRVIVHPQMLLMLAGTPAMTPCGAELKTEQESEVAGTRFVVTGPAEFSLSGDVAGQAVVVPIEAGEEVLTNGEIMLFTRELTFHRVPELLTTLVSFSAPAGSSGHAVVLHAFGAVVIRELADGESLFVAAHSLLFAQATVKRKTIAEISEPAGGWIGVNEWVRVTGPGRICMQSGTHSGSGREMPASSTAKGNESSVQWQVLSDTGIVNWGEGRL